MKKLVKLLNQYEKERLIKIGCEIDEDIEYYGRSLENGEIVNWNYDRDVHSFLKYYIISKDYEFIKWLVDNDKIDLEGMRDNWGDMMYHFTDEDLFLMSLAKSDKPIEDLISILK